jgi:DNA end-binding protein Ku
MFSGPSSCRDFRLSSKEQAVASRPIWNGHLKLSLVSCAISMFSATTQSEKISFNMLNASTGHRLRQQYVDEETREIVEREDRIKGYNLGDDTYITVTEEEFDQVEIPSTHMIDIERFVDASEIDRVYFDDCYFVAPDDEVGADAFAVIRDSMRERAVVGIGRIVMFRRERPILIEPRGKGILATTLRYNYEVKDDRPYLAAVESRKASEEMVDLAGYIIDKKHGRFDPASFEDRYQNALAELIEAKQAGKPPAPIERAAKPPPVVNLLEALRDSVARETAGASSPRRRGSGAKAQRTPRASARPAPKAPKPGQKAS